MKPAISVSCAVAFALMAGPSSAHHSFAPFDMDRPVRLTGTLTKVDWRNPHIEISIDVTRDQGIAELWLIEGGPPARFKDYGVSKDSFVRALGLIVTVETGIARDGSRHGHMQTITFPDGTKATSR